MSNTNPARAYFEAKSAYDAAKKAMETAKSELVSILDAAQCDALTMEGFEVKRSESVRMAFDSKAFKADFEDIFEEYKRPQTVKHFTVNAA